MQESERVLVQRAISRDRTAFVALYDRYVSQVYRHVYFRIYNQIIAEDITQDAFIKAWKAIHRYKITGAPFVAWLLTIAHNLLMDHFKATKKLASLDEVAEISLPGNAEDDPQTIIEAEFDRSTVRDAILHLKGVKQKVILMRFIDGFSYKEIAAILQKTEGAIRVIQYRALTDLKRILIEPEYKTHEKRGNTSPMPGGNPEWAHDD